MMSNHDGWGQSMMGERQVHQDALFYEFSLERHVPERHLLRSIDRFVELEGCGGHWRRLTVRRDGHRLIPSC